MDHLLLGGQDPVLALHLCAGFAPGKDVCAQGVGVGLRLGVDLIAFCLGIGQDLGAVLVSLGLDLGAGVFGVKADFFDDFI